MNILEFKAAIRPQLELQIARWFCRALESADRRNIAVGFRTHMQTLLMNDKACCTLRNLIQELPLSLKNEEPEYMDELTRHVLELFFVMVNRYAHLDRSASISLKLRAYEYRLANMLAELKELADAAVTPFAKMPKRARASGQVLRGFDRVVIRNGYGPVVNSWGRTPLPSIVI